MPRKYSECRFTTATASILDRMTPSVSPRATAESWRLPHRYLRVFPQVLVAFALCEATVRRLAGPDIPRPPDHRTVSAEVVKLPADPPAGAVATARVPLTGLTVAVLPG